MRLRFTNHAKTRLNTHFPGTPVRDANLIISQNIYKLKEDVIRGKYILQTEYITFVLSKDLIVITVYKNDNLYTALLLKKINKRKIDDILYYNSHKNDTTKR